MATAARPGQTGMMGVVAAGGAGVRRVVVGVVWVTGRGGPRAAEVGGQWGALILHRHMVGGTAGTALTVAVAVMSVAVVSAVAVVAVAVVA